MTGPGEDADADPDFFVSYTHSDERWAEWVAWVLEDAGCRVVMQAWDFGPGSHFAAEINQATRRAVRTIVLLSTAYQASVFAAAEWQAAWVTDPGGRDRRLLVFRVEDCPRDGLLRQIVSVDLHGIDRDTAKARLLGAVCGYRRKPTDEPLFPFTGGSGRVEPPLPVRAEVWRVPWPRNPNFIGRTDELAVLRERFTAVTVAAVPQAMHGLGGVGKTQLAVEYAYRYATNYELVWWVPAEQTALIVTALEQLAVQLGVGVASNSSAILQGA